MKNMKLYFIPFSYLVIAKFPEGRWYKVSFHRFRNLGIWAVIVGRHMLFNDYRLLDKHHEDIMAMGKQLEQEGKL